MNLPQPEGGYNKMKKDSAAILFFTIQFLKKITFSAELYQRQFQRLSACLCQLHR